MRFILGAATVAAILSGPAWAQSTWTEFNYPDSGFAVSFPANPAVGHMTVKAPDGTDAHETLYVVRQEQAIYRIAVTEFKDATVDGNTAINQAVAALRERGSVTLDLPARVNRNRGRQLSITGNEGSHSTVAIFFAGQKLYQIDGTVLASNSDPVSGELIRFQQSLRFTGDNGGRFGGGFAGRGFRGRDGNGVPEGRGLRNGRRFRQDGNPPQNTPESPAVQGNG